jgi:hypothetical protein
MEHNIITHTLVPENTRADHVGNLFGVRWIWIESFAFDTASSLSEQYEGGLWTFHSLSNGGFFLSPSCRSIYTVQCDNGFEGTLSSEAFGITASLYAYSGLSFSPDANFAQLCADHFHKLRELVLQHAEGRSILLATD